ncbi:tetratricopeptide repeat protein [bacterium]|nr:tetratricopeptide repeat protein [bacterium]
MNRGIRQILLTVGIFFLWLNVHSAQSTDYNQVAEEQFNYAKTIEENARQQRSIEGLQKAVREHKKVFFYPDAIEWVYKSFHNIEKIVDMLMILGNPHIPEGNQYVSPLIEECEQTIQDYPGTDEAAIAQFAIGNIYRSQWYQHWKGGYSFKDVTQAFQKVVDNYPQSPLVPHALMEVANSYDLTGYTTDDGLKAIAIYQQVIKKYPDTLYASLSQYNIGVVCFNMEEHKKSIKEYEKVITNFPNHEYYGSNMYAHARKKIKWVLSETALPATIELQPDKWNIEWLKEHPGEGKINCYIGNIGTYAPQEIDTSSIKLNATIPAENPQIINKHPGFTGNVLKVKVNKFKVIKTIQEPEVDKEYEIMVYGTFSDEKLFYGISTIQIIGGNGK